MKTFLILLAFTTLLCGNPQSCRAQDPDPTNAPAPPPPTPAPRNPRVIPAPPVPTFPTTPAPAPAGRSFTNAVSRAAQAANPATPNAATPNAVAPAATPPRTFPPRTTGLPPAGAVPGAAPTLPQPNVAPGLSPPVGSPVTPPIAAVITPTTTNLAGLSGITKIPEKIINLQVAPIDQVLTIYADLTGRTILRPTTLPNVSITLRNQQELTKAEAIQALESVLALNGVTMIDVGEKFVSAVPTQQALQEGAAFSKTEAKDLDETGQFVTKVVQLKHALPSEVQQIVQTFGKVQNGIVAIDSTQTLVLRDYPANIKRMMELIERIDVKVESDYKLEVIPIRYGKVEEIYGTMSSLIGGGGGGAGIATAGGLGSAASRRTGGTSSRAGLNYGMRSRTTSGSQYGSQSGYGSQYGSGYRGGTYTPQQVATTPASPTRAGTTGTFNQRLQQIVSRMSGPGAGGSELDLLANARIVPDERSNSLIVFANKEEMALLTNIVNKVDRLMAQVLIEAIIMDVQLTDSYSFGVTALMRPQKTGDLTSLAGMSNGPSLVSGLTNITSGLPEGFSYFGRLNGDLDVAVKALASDGRGQILATPRVQTTHAMTATFTVGESVPYVTSTYYGGFGYGPSAQLQQLDVETYLNVTPYITPDGLVVMELDQNIEEITGYTEIANVGKMPNTTRRSTQTTVSVQDRDTIIIGGYIRASKANSKSGVPILKDIPVMGGLFRSTSKDAKRSELIVLIRPTVLTSPKDAAEQAILEQNRLPGIREMEKEWRDDYRKLQEHADDVTGEDTWRD